MIKELNATTVEKPVRTVKILQFGEGNFLRAFVDWQIDIANEAGVTDHGVVIIEPRGNATMIDLLNKQSNLYHVYLEGIKDGKPTKEVRLVKSVQESVSSYRDYAKYEKYILSPDLKIVVSNTTEAGITYVEDDDLTATPPTSFPGKVTALLYHRFKHFNGDPTKGLMFICCELIEDNATTLHKYVLRHAERTDLGADFINWVETACTFCDSLVDRIVPGFPRDNINEIKEELGFDDNLVVKGEFYHLWVIGGKGYEKLQAELPLDKAGLHVVFQPSIKAFRDKKVRILNGSHTGMVPVALQLGCETVADAFHTPIVNKFINEMVEKEVLPVIEGDQVELKAFSAEILERFLNPYIKHYLKSIALNSLSKWEARNFPTVKDNSEKKGQLAKYECFTFAALLALYSPDSTFEPDDTKEHVEYIRSNWNASDLHTTVQKIVKESGIFLLDFSQVPGFVDTVAEYLTDIKAKGMEAALTNFLARQ
jgi:tagaturonate reductase